MQIGVINGLALLRIGIEIHQMRIGQRQGGIRKCLLELQDNFEILPFDSIQLWTIPIWKSVAIGTWLPAFEESALIYAVDHSVFGRVPACSLQ